MSPDETSESVDSVYVANASLIFVQMSQATEQRLRRQLFLIINFVDLSVSSELGVNTVKAYPVSPAIAKHIEKPLGFVSRPSQGLGLVTTDKEALFAFISTEYWICTFLAHRNGKGGRIRKHFFLPRDWLNLDCLNLATISEDGTFYCPRNGEIAIVRNGLNEEWID